METFPTAITAIIFALAARNIEAPAPLRLSVGMVALILAIVSLVGAIRQAKGGTSD